MTQRTTELRHLNAAQMHEISLILNENDSWKRLMSIIPKSFSAVACSSDNALNWEKLIEEVGFKYTNDHIRQISTPRQGDSRLSSEIFLDEWATSGKKETRPTVGVLLQLLVKAELFRAADYVAEKLLNEPPPKRPLEGPAARIDISLPSSILEDVASYANDSAFYPNTEDIRVNAQLMNGMSQNNQDFYTKFRCEEKNIGNIYESENPPKPAPRTRRRTERLSEQNSIQNQQTNTEDNEATAAATAITATVNGLIVNGEHDTIATEITEVTEESGPINGECRLSEDGIFSTPQLPQLSFLLSQNNAEDPTSEEISTSIIPENSVPIPLLSALQKTSSTTETIKSDSIMSDIGNMPILSALNLNGQHEGVENCQQNGNCSSESDNDEDDEEIDDNDDNSLHNLGSSNNDSSLTNITGTSGENSFELSSSSTSNENIPLNVLQY